MRGKDKIVLWPSYFDRTKTRGQGRRAPKSLGVVSPQLSEIKEAAEDLDLNCEVVTDASYPKTPWRKTGMLLVVKEEPKQTTIKKIGRKLSTARKENSQK